jgi:hypothetical protein
METNMPHTLNTIFTEDISQLESLDYSIPKNNKITKLNFEVEIITNAGLFKRLVKKFGHFNFFYFSNYDFVYVVSNNALTIIMKIFYIIGIFLTISELFDIIIFNFISNRTFVIRRKIDETQLTYIVPKEDFNLPNNSIN